MSHPQRVRPLTILATALLALGACSHGDPTSSPAAAAVETAPAPLTVDEGASGLFFRYLDPSTGKVETASRPGEIPASARKQVVVYSDNEPTPAGWEHVADLSGGLPTTTRPTRGFALATPAVAPRSAPHAASKGAHQVVMFVTKGCPYCRKARAFFKKKGVPFTEHDIERDPKAPELLAQLGRKAGAGPQQLQGVPLIFVDDHLIAGFDRPRLEQLLGLR